MNEPNLPAHVSIERVEQYLDRVAIAIHHSTNKSAILPIYEWLERQLEAKRRERKSLDSAMARVAAIGARATKTGGNRK